MKKTIYLIIMAVITTFCIIGGSLYHIGGLLTYNKNFEITIENKEILTGKDNDSSSKGNVTPTESFEASSFDSVLIDAEILSITIESGDSDSYDLTYDCVSWLTPEITTENGRLIIKQPSVSKITGNNNYCNMTLIVPAGAELKNVNIETEIGEILINNCKIKTAELSTEVGEIHLSDCDFTDLDISSEVGDVAVTTRSDLSDYEMELSTDLGTIVINNTNYKREYVQRGTPGKELDVETELGSIKLNYSPAR